MRIEIISFGKIKSGDTLSLFNYFIMLCTKYTQIDHKILKDPGERKINLGDLSKHKVENYIVLDAQGKSYTTEEFSSFVKYNEKITFIIGNAFGFEEEVKKSATGSLSLSKMTMNHELALLVFSEQLFRCLNLNSGGKYHK